MRSFAASHTFRAFGNRNYTLFFCGQSVSQIGTWMQRTAVSWVVYSLSQSAFMLGLTVFAQQFPSFLLSLWGGIVSDRYRRYKILLVTQVASMVQAMALAALTLWGHYHIWHIMALSVVLGIINAFDVPARQPMVHELINDKEDLTNALALNSAMVNLARLLGPALSGLVLQHYGAGACFSLNALSFVAVLASLLLMRLPAQPRPVARKAVTELAEGFRYVRETPAIRTTLLMLALVSLLVLPYDTLVPVFAKTVFRGNAATFGYISSFMGLGAIAGTFLLASLRKGADLRRVLLLCSFTLGVGLVAFSHTTYFPAAMALAVVAGFGTMSQNTTSITIIQVESSQAMRGRMMSYVALAYFGMLPLGSLLVGALSQQVGAPNAMLCQGVAAIVIAAVFARHLRKDRLDASGAIEEAENITAGKV